MRLSFSDSFFTVSPAPYCVGIPASKGSLKDIKAPDADTLTRAQFFSYSLREELEQTG